MPMRAHAHKQADDDAGRTAIQIGASCRLTRQIQGQLSRGCGRIAKEFDCKGMTAEGGGGVAHGCLASESDIS